MLSFFQAMKSAARDLILTQTDAETLSIVKEAIKDERERISLIAMWLKDMISTSIEEELK